MTTVAQAPISDLVGSLKKAGLIAIGQYQNEAVEFPSAWRAAQRQIDPEVDEDTLAETWATMSNEDHLDILRSNVPQLLLDSFYQGQQGQVLIETASRLNLDISRMGPGQRAILDMLANNVMIKTVTNNALAGLINKQIKSIRYIACSVKHCCC